MAKTFQSTTVAGYITEPETGYSRNNKPYLQFSVPASVKTGSDADGKPVYEKYYYTVKYWNESALRNAERFQKGDYVIISGTVKVSAYIGSQDGQAHISQEFIPGFELKAHVTEREDYEDSGSNSGNSNNRSSNYNRGNSGNAGGSNSGFGNKNQGGGFKSNGGNRNFNNNQSHNDDAGDEETPAPRRNNNSRGFGNRN